MLGLPEQKQSLILYFNRLIVTFDFCTAKLLPVGYGIRKLQIACVVEDDKVGTDQLEELITA
uniref:Translation elongation factor EF1B beta/delta subunit guanine nucleotide exchange domain-containing protein n=1 Tax=Cyprinus carpio TaxID=7962 RepID=A0A8C2JWD2_CYPCA